MPYGNKRVHLVHDLSVFTEDNLNTLYNYGGIIPKPFSDKKKNRINNCSCALSHASIASEVVRVPKHRRPMFLIPKEDAKLEMYNLGKLTIVIFD